MTLKLASEARLECAERLGICDWPCRSCWSRARSIGPRREALSSTSPTLAVLSGRLVAVA